MGRFQLARRAVAGASPRAEGLFSRTEAFSLLDDDGACITERAGLETLTLARVTSTGHDVTLVESRLLTLLIPGRGRLETETGEVERSVTRGGAILLPPSRRRTRVLRERHRDYAANVLLIPPEALRAAAVRLDPAMAERLRIEDLTAMLDGGASPSAGRFMEHVGALMAELDRPDSLLARESAQRSAANLVLDMLIDLLEQAGALPSEARPASPAALRTVRRAEEVMRDRFGDIESVSEVAEAVGVGLRTLQLGFRAARGISPLAALSAIRLEAAHDRLKAPRPLDTVSGVAFECGFNHLGRFAAAYRARFGEAPSATLREGMGRA